MRFLGNTLFTLLVRALLKRQPLRKMSCCLDFFAVAFNMRGPIAVLMMLLIRAAYSEQIQPPKEVLADEVVFFEEPNRSKALEMLESSQMHVYASGLSDPEIKRKIESSKEVAYTLSYGNSWEIAINPAGPVFLNGKLNPFSVPAIREALNWMIDRNYIAQELCSGLARPKFLPIVSAFPDYARMADVCRAIEIRYGYNPDKAKEIISREMKNLGATQQNGKWLYKDGPVQIVFLIRTEDVRKRMGDYIASLLEGAGFSVDRQYKTAAEASPIWVGGNPAEGKWNLYTGGWISTLIQRDQSDNFNYYYTSKGRPDSLWQAYKPSPRFAEIADRLARSDYKTWDERMTLMAEALELSNQECFRVWLVDAINYFPLRKDVNISSDLAGGINGSFLWMHTARFQDQTKRQMKIGMPSIMTEPWNPVAGSNWIYDKMITRGTHAHPVVPDPFTGLFRPLRVQSAQVTAQEGMPILKSLDWVDLNFLPEIEVPGDALIEWNCKEQRFVSVKEKHPEGLKSRTKTIVQFENNLFKHHFHDGTPQTLADLMVGVIVGFERASKDSLLFDEATVPAFETFTQYFRGFKITREDPLVLEIYSDRSYPDAEEMAGDAATFIYPMSESLPPWHTLALGILAEGDRKLAFSADKSEKMKIERMSYIAGPSLAILEDIMKKAEADGYIPFEKFMSKYVTREQARQRYAALRQWYAQKKHFWVGNGPYFIDSIHPLEKTIVCKRFDEFREPDPRWMNFVEPRIAQVKVSGPVKVTIGEAAEFKINVSFKGSAYPAKDIDFVKFLVFNSKSEVILSTNAELIQDGEWVAKLPAEKSKELKPGTNRLEVAVTPKIVSLATFESVRFVSLPNR